MSVIALQNNQQAIANLVSLQAIIYSSEQLKMLPGEAQYQQMFANAEADSKITLEHYSVIGRSGVQGQITAIVNDDFIDDDGRCIGLIGFFECVDNYRHAQQLLTAAITYLQKQKIEKIWAPVQFDIWRGCRFKTAGFKQPPFHGEPINPDYYPVFFQRFGFALVQDWCSFEIQGRKLIQSIIDPLEPYYHTLRDQGYRFESLQLSQHKLFDLYRILRQCSLGFLGYSALSYEQFLRYFLPRLETIDRRFCSLVYDPDKDVCGFCIAYPEADEQSKAGLQSKGRVISYMHGIAKTQSARVNGLGRAVVYYSMQQVLQAGNQTVIAALIARGNPSKGVLGRRLLPPERTYALYGMTF